jgi:acyl carrier protein
MDRAEFLEELTELLEVEEAVTADTSFEGMEEYDSLAVMSLIAFIDENFDKTISGVELSNVKGVKELITLIGEDNIS